MNQPTFAKRDKKTLCVGEIVGVYNNDARETYTTLKSVSVICYRGGK
jgi:hypothetical protein